MPGGRREAGGPAGELAEYIGLINAAHGRVVQLVGHALDEKLWQGWGIHSPAHWLAWQAGMSPLRANQVVALAERIDELPTAAGLLVDGALSVDQAVEIARHVPADFEKSASEMAPGCTVTQLRRTLPHYPYREQARDEDRQKARDEGVSDDAPPEAPEPIAEKRDLSTGIDDDGTWWMKVRGPVDEGAVIEAAVRAARDDLYRQACEGLDDGDPRPTVTLFDGLLGVAETAMRAAETAHPNSDRYLIYAHLEAGPGDDPVGIASLHLGPILPDHLRRLHTCDGTLRPVLERDGTPVNVGRDERIVHRRIRRLIEHRDGGCAVPGCHRRSALQVHHIVHWEDGGATDTYNLVCVCATHHRLHHRNLLGIAGNADHPGGPGGLRFHDRWGRLLDPSGTPVLPTAGQTLHETGRGLGIDVAPYVRPFGERLDRSAVTFSRLRPEPETRGESAAETEPPPDEAGGTPPHPGQDERDTGDPTTGDPATPPRAGPESGRRAA